MRNFILITLLLLGSISSWAQSLRAYERAGDASFRDKDFAAAAQHYSTVLQRDDDNPQILWKYAESTRMFNAFPEAERAYRKISTSKKGRKEFPLVDLRLSEVKKAQGDYPAAIELLENFITSNPTAPAESLRLAQSELASCRLAQELSADKTKLEIKHLGKEINSPYSDFAPVMIGDTLFFSSYRFDKKNDRRPAKSKITKIMFSMKGGRAREPGKGFPAADSAHIAHTAFSPDGRYVFFTVCKNLNASDIRCELWFTLLDRRKRWLPAVRLPEPVNMPGYTATQPSVGYDRDLEGLVLWFASDRPGGKGKMDLWSVPLDTNFFCPCNLPLPGKKIGKLPKFETPQDASAINTPENDITPFFHGPTQQLWFSSDGLPGMGGYDIFWSKKDSTLLRPPQNAGAGLNTSYNDLYLFLKPDGKNGYLSSNRPGSFYLDEKNKACCNDIFSFQLPEPPVVTPPAQDSIPGLAVKSPPQIPELPVPPVADPPKLQDFVGLPLYFDNDEPDKRTHRTTTQKTYETTAQAYLERENDYRINFSTGLRGTKQEEAESMIEDFFDNEVRRGYDRLAQLCDVILTRLQNGEQLEVLIKGFTSPRAQSDYNINLGKRRISSVRNQFSAFADGALQPYLAAGQLKVTETSFGETTARLGISDNLQDERNSIYHPDAARERRVEIVEIREKK